MADQGKWFKLWCTSLRDDALEDLSLEDWARWVRLGTHIKENGKDGKIRFAYPARNLVNLFRVPTFEAALDIIKRFPNVQLGERSSTVSPETNANVTYEIEYQNWFKYQGDFSSDRVRKFRDKKRHHETAQEEKRRDKKRREVFAPPTETEVLTFAKDEGFSIDAKKFCNFYASKGWLVGKVSMKDWRAAARNWKSDAVVSPGGIPAWMRTNKTP